MADKVPKCGYSSQGRLSLVASDLLESALGTKSTRHV